MCIPIPRWNPEFISRLNGNSSGRLWVVWMTLESETWGKPGRLTPLIPVVLWMLGSNWPVVSWLSAGWVQFSFCFQQPSISTRLCESDNMPCGSIAEQHPSSILDPQKWKHSDPNLLMSPDCRPCNLTELSYQDQGHCQRVTHWRNSSHQVCDLLDRRSNDYWALS